MKMTTEDKEALKEFLTGFLFVCGVLLVIYGLFMLLSNKTENEKFKVVDTYKNCEVVRYAPGNTATYKYFLDCSK